MAMEIDEIVRWRCLSFDNFLKVFAGWPHFWELRVPFICNFVIATIENGLLCSINWTKTVPTEQCELHQCCLWQTYCTHKVKIVSNEYRFDFSAKIDLKSTSKTLEQNANKTKKMCFKNKTIRNEHAQNPKQIINQMVKSYSMAIENKWNAWEKKNTPDGDRNNGPSKWFSTKHEHSSNHRNEHNNGILLSAHLN